VINLRKELLDEKKEKNTFDSKSMTQKKEISDLKQKSLKSEQTIKDLEAEVKEKAKAVKIKDAACMNIKSKKEESEQHLNEALNELNFLKSEVLLKSKRTNNILKCPFCDMRSDSRVKLDNHVKASHYSDMMCKQIMY
jgi:DNA repair exonuclease SbcCD ATPase subunit